MKNLVFAAFAIATFCVFAQEPQQEAKTRKPVAERLGGRVVKPGSQKGKIAIINTQSKVDGTNFVAVAQSISNDTKLNVVCETAETGDATALKNAAKANFVVIVVDDDKTPAMLVAPEDGWAVVNVSKMDRGLRTDAAKAKFFVGRCRKEVVRAFSLLCGGGISQYPGNVMNAAKLEAIDRFDEKIPQDKVDAYKTYLAEYGVTPAIETVYVKALREGWAPEPKTDAQKVLWEQYHSKPTEPMRIKFDPKQGE